jgi:hypothetical protein
MSKFGATRFTLTLLFPLFNILINSLLFTLNDFVIFGIRIGLGYGLMGATTFLFLIPLTRYVIKPINKRYINYRNSLAVLYMAVVLFAAVPNSVSRLSGDIPIFFVPLFTAYLVHIVDNMHRFKF